jgi:hypothetical protein
MRVKFTVAGVEDFEDMALDLEAVPREGETVMLPGFDAGLSVRTVMWYPKGGPESEDGAGVLRERGPFAYVLLGPVRGVM